MKAKTRFFGEIDIEDEKIFTLEKGMIGFPELNHFALIFDEDKNSERPNIMWFQSMDDGDIAFPVMRPDLIKEDYKPTVTEEIIDALGEITEENLFILVTVSVPGNVKEFSVNLKAPIVINTDNNKGMQAIVEDDYPIKYMVYELLQAMKEKREKAGE